MQRWDGFGQLKEKLFMDGKDDRIDMSGYEDSWTKAKNHGCAPMYSDVVNESLTEP